MQRITAAPGLQPGQGSAQLGLSAAIEAFEHRLADQRFSRLRAARGGAESERDHAVPVKLDEEVGGGEGKPKKLTARGHGSIMPCT
ncbi:MAG: hypothetical protein ACK51C_05295, partial [Brevundimonas sp.]|uniref:hypothetical protein n=1 Tax=Brevundimonas sp. TaxID=1871086 RepID=UPI00391F3B5E